MAEKAITFRPTDEVAAIVNQKRDEGCNISAWLNQMISAAAWKARKDNSARSLRFIPEGNAKLYRDKEIESLKMCAVPIGQLSAKSYGDYIETIHRDGLQLYRFSIDTDHTMSIICVNREEASVEFSRYYSRNSENEPYIRTALPFPTIYFDRQRKTVIIEQYEAI